MRVAHYALIAGVALGVGGFAVAVFLENRQLGMTIFMLGFFLGAASAVYAALTSGSGDFGKMGLPIKIAAGGFGLIVLSQLLDFVLDEASSIGNTFFFIGLTVMMVGILAAAVRMAR